jgi:HAD superfamily hydrolase (TIGR01509 family)
MLFIFDMDNVLYDYHWRIRMESLTELTGHDFHDLRARWWHDDGEWKAEAGDPDTGDEYLRLVNDAFGSSIPRQTWVDIRKAAMEFRPDVADAVSHASKHGQVTLLTNNGMLIGEHLQEVAPDLVPLFGEHMFATAHYRARKPDPTVFSRVLERYGSESTDTFFVDDHPDNIRGAEEIGITSKWFSPSDTGDSVKEAITAFVASRS